MREDKNGKTPGAGVRRGRQNTLQTARPSTAAILQEGDERHEPEGRGEPGAGRERGRILHPAWSCEGALMPSSAQGCSGESQSLRWETLGEKGREKQVLHKGEGLLAGSLGDPPDLCAGDTGDAPSCRGCVSKPGPAARGQHRRFERRAPAAKVPACLVRSGPGMRPSLPPSFSLHRPFPPEPANPQVYLQHPGNTERPSRGAKNPAPLPKFLGALELQRDALPCLCLG